MRKFFLILIVNCARVALLAPLLIPSTRDCFAQSITWFKSYASWEDDQGNAIIQTPDNGYILVGLSSVFGLRTIRLNAYGDTIWNRIFPGSDGADIIKTNDNNYIILGIYAVTKIDINGNIIWTKQPTESVVMGSIKEELNGNFLICGGKDTLGLYRKPYLLKLNTNGNMIWQKTFNGNILDGLFSYVNLSNDNNYILTGSLTYLNDTNTNQLFVMKADTSGNQLAFYDYDTLYNGDFIHQQLNGSFVVSGTGVSYLINIDGNGTIQWYKRYLNGKPSYCGAISNTKDKGYVLTGAWDTAGNQNESSVFLIKTDSIGNESFIKAYLYAKNDADGGRGIKQTSDSGYVITGGRGNQNVGDIIALKTDKNGQINTIGIQPISNIVPDISNLYQNFPNPFNPVTKIRFDVHKNTFVNLKILSILGQEITKLVSEKLSAGNYEVEFNGRNISSGIYFYKLSTDFYTETRKMILAK